jgi:hypothetical protein
VLAFAVVITGLVWRSGFIPLPQSISNHGGDALWALIVFLGFGLLFSRKSTASIAMSALAFSWVVEFSQLYRAPWFDEIRATLPGRLVLGNTFSWIDLAAYTLGVGLGACIERRFSRQR